MPIQEISPAQEAQPSTGEEPHNEFIGCRDKLNNLVVEFVCQYHGLEDLHDNCREERWAREWKSQTSANIWGALSQRWKERKLEASALRWATEQEIPEDQRDAAMAHYKRHAYNQAHDRSRQYVDLAQIERTWRPSDGNGPLPDISPVDFARTFDWGEAFIGDVECPCLDLTECQTNCLVKVHGLSREQAFRVARQGGRIVDGVIQHDANLAEQTEIVAEAFRYQFGRYPSQNEFNANIRLLQTGALTLDDFRQRNERFQTACAIAYRLPYQIAHQGEGTSPRDLAPRRFLGRVNQDVEAGQMVNARMLAFDEASDVPEQVWRSIGERNPATGEIEWTRAERVDIVDWTEEHSLDEMRELIGQAFRSATGSSPNEDEIQGIYKLIEDDELDKADLACCSIHFLGILPKVTAPSA